MKALEIIKKLMGPDADAAEVEVFTSVKQRTLFNWFETKPQVFRSTVIGAAEIKKKLNLKPNEIERKKIIILTKQFIENEGYIEKVKSVVIDTPAKARIPDTNIELL